jgi:RNA polymerase sigma-70 factor (ECF subfamily)
VEDFEGWYRATHRGVVASLVTLTRDADVAREAADEAFAAALSRWEIVRAMRSPTGWVFQVALNRLRRIKRRAALEERLLRRHSARTPDSIPHPEVWTAVRQLPERQRIAIVLRYVADLPETDIAEAMGVRRGTVSSTLADARRRLAELLADDRQIEEVLP